VHELELFTSNLFDQGSFDIPEEHDIFDRTLYRIKLLGQPSLNEALFGMSDL